MIPRVRKLKIGSLVVMLLFLAGLIVLPLIFGDNRLYMSVFIYATLWAILAMSWDILSGYTGQISFGHAFFFGIGGYTAALAGKELGMEPYLTIPLAGFLAMIGGLILAAPALRLKGPYLSLLTLVAAIGIDELVRFLKIGASGADGAIINDYLNGKIIPIISTNQTVVYYIALALMLAVAVFLILIAKSRIGLAFEAIRDDEEAAEAAGINTAKYKVFAFALSGFIAGIPGAFYVHYNQTASPAQVFKLDIGIEAIVASVLGGMGTIFGPIGGAYFLIIVRDIVLRDVLQPIQEYRFLILFALALLILFVIPRGILTEIKIRFLKWIKAGRPKATKGEAES